MFSSYKEGIMTERYKILGIDPGTNITGYSIIEIRGNSAEFITSGTMQLQTFTSHQMKLKEIFLQIQEIIETYLPKEMAIEAPFYGKNVQSMLKLGRAQGVAMAAAMTMGLKIYEYSPKKIKLAITGNGNASKEQVHAMLQHRMKIQLEDKYLDASDALAAALCHFQQKSSPSSEGKSYANWSAYAKANPEKRL
jgi:crossover junction endodeoxyribonuclease RuvC